MSKQTNESLIPRPHFTLNEWVMDSMETLGKVAAYLSTAELTGDTEVTNEALRELAPNVEGLAKSFHELVTPKKPKVDRNAELAKLRAAFGMPDHIKPAPQKGIEHEALSDELGKIATMIGEYEPKFSPLASRLFTLSCRVHNEGVNNDESLPF